MTQYVICALQMEGFHCWPEADGELAYEEQISLFEALSLNGAWSNAACTGYCLLAMQRAGLDEKTIEKVLHELHWAFDDTSVQQAEKIYCGGEE